MRTPWLIAEPEPYDEYDLGPLKTGKEAEVFLVERVAADGRSCLLAHKRYRPRTVAYKGELQALGFQRAANFVNDRAYRDGRSIGNSRDRRAAAEDARATARRCSGRTGPTTSSRCWSASRLRESRCRSRSHAPPTASSCSTSATARWRHRGWSTPDFLARRRTRRGVARREPAAHGRSGCRPRRPVGLQPAVVGGRPLDHRRPPSGRHHHELAGVRLPAPGPDERRGVVQGERRRLRPRTTLRRARRDRARIELRAGAGVGGASGRTLSGHMGEQREPAPVRLAELVAALSLGIDLGFGQPMEHVLRQCLIALRLVRARSASTKTSARSSTTRRCSSTSAATPTRTSRRKWFGDDIALQGHEVRPRPVQLARHDRDAAPDRRREPAVASRPHRPRVRVLGPPRSGRHDGAQHAVWRGRSVKSSACPTTVLDALRARTSVGTGAAGPDGVAGDAIPIASRVVQLAEFVEVAHRCRWRRRRPRRGRARARASSSTRCSSSTLCADIDEDLRRRSTKSVHGTAVIDAEPSLAIVLSTERVRRRAAGDRELRRPQVAVHARALARRRRARGRGRHDSSGCRTTRCATLHRAGLVHDFGRLGVSNSIWDKRGPLGAGEWERVRLHPYFTERMLQQSDDAGPARAHRRAAPRAARRVGLPTRAGRRAPSRAPARVLGAADAYQAMREPRPYRPALTPR